MLHTITRWPVLQKVHGHLSLPLLVSIRFQVLFHSPPGVLFTFPSRYCFAIGHWVVFSLGGWAPRLQTGLHVSGPTPDPTSLLWISPTGVSPSAPDLSGVLRLSSKVHVVVHTPESKLSGLGSFPFARRYYENRCFFLFLGLLRCFSSPRFPLMTYGFSHGYLLIKAGGFPHSEICGSQDMCSFPQLIAACHVLRRLPVPRHPPNALIRLTWPPDLAIKSGFFTIVKQ